MTKNEGYAFPGTQVGKPLPGEHALGCHSEPLSIRFYGSQELLGIAGHVPVQENLSCLVDDAQVHCADVEINAAIVLVLLGIETHRGFLLFGGSHQNATRLVAKGEASISIKRLAADGQRLPQ